MSKPARCPNCVAHRHTHCWAYLHTMDATDNDGTVTPWPCVCACRTVKRPHALRVECGHCGRQHNLPAEKATVVVDIVMDGYYELRFDCPSCGGGNGGPLPATLGRQLVDQSHVQLAMNEGGYA